MSVLLLPLLPFCGPSASGDRMREAQDIFGCLMHDLRYARSGFSYLYYTILAWPVLLKLLNSFLNGLGLLVRTPVGSISHFVPGVDVCGTGPPIHRLQPGLHQRHWVVPCRQIQVVLPIYSSLRHSRVH